MMACMTVSESRAGAIHTVPNSTIIFIPKIFSCLTSNGDTQKIPGYLWFIFFSMILVTFRGSRSYPCVLEILIVVAFVVINGK